MTMQRIMWIFCGIGIAALLLALIGHFVLDWGNDGVGVWTGIGAGYLLALRERVAAEIESRLA